MPKRPRIHEQLLSWYDANKRDLPWRGSNDPYAVWVSEIMLQQTQVATVLPYYERWFSRFPDVRSLAEADEQEVLSMWQGLGYYRRCRMLHAGAKYVSTHGFPKNAKEWLRVPGVGRYTAGAIASISLQEPVPLVDGNVERVFARYEGSEVAGKELHAGAWEWASSVLCKQRPGDWNQALMELGATVCKPVAPSCGLCPLERDCVAKKKDLQTQLPKRLVTAQAIKLEERTWIPYCDGLFGLRQIPEGKWWHGMWEFPRADVTEPDATLLHIVGQGVLERAGQLTYHVTNHRIALAVFLHRSSMKSEALSWHHLTDLKHLPMPAPQRKALRLALQRLEAPALMPEEANSR